MARSKSGRMTAPRRDISIPPIASRMLSRPLLPRPYVPPPQTDRRFYDPTRTVRRPHSLVSAATRIKAVDHGLPVNKAFLGHRLAFSIPRLVALCVRRKTRKEVLHALRKTGGGSGRRRPRRNFWSNVKC